VRYGATTVLRDVDFDIRAGEVHAVVGENGAGKSTLLRSIAGVTPPAAGSLHRQPGVRVAWVPQETVLPPDLSVASWIFLGRELRGRFGMLRESEMQQGASAALHHIGCGTPSHARIGADRPAQPYQYSGMDVVTQDNVGAYVEQWNQWEKGG
jgi:ribose transport system ATP-binding protein